MTNDELKKLRDLLKRNCGKEITPSLLQSQLGLGFKEADYIINKLTEQKVLDENGINITSEAIINVLSINDDNAIKNLDYLDDIYAIIKRDGEFDQHKVEQELNLSSNMLFDLIGELLNKGVIERVDSDYRLKK